LQWELGSHLVAVEGAVMETERRRGPTLSVSGTFTSGSAKLTHTVEVTLVVQ